MTNNGLQGGAFKKGTTPDRRHRPIQGLGFPPEHHGDKQDTATTPSRRERRWNTVIAGLTRQSGFSPRPTLAVTKLGYGQPRHHH